ncbi:hypothetical protein ACHAWF_008234 [Thalassiosira exigua]
MIASKLAVVTTLCLATSSSSKKAGLRLPEADVLVASDAEEDTETFVLPDECTSPLELKARIAIPIGGDSLNPFQSFGTSCNITYFLVDIEGNTLANVTKYHNWWDPNILHQLTYGSKEDARFKDWHGDISQVGSLKIEIGCADAVLLDWVKLQCATGSVLGMKTWTNVAQWGDRDLIVSKGYCLSTDPDEKGWGYRTLGCAKSWCFMPGHDNACDVEI